MSSIEPLTPPSFAFVVIPPALKNEGNPFACFR
jgi:hypothetical protein